MNANNSNDTKRLQMLYVALPETTAQEEKRNKLIKALEYKLRIRTKTTTAIVENGEIDDPFN
ncbi:MAG: hypothetical protein WCW84_14460 [Sulfurimonas sp.]|jgi:hypothetical protein